MYILKHVFNKKKLTSEYNMEMVLFPRKTKSLIREINPFPLFMLQQNKIRRNSLADSKLIIQQMK